MNRLSTQGTRSRPLTWPVVAAVVIVPVVPACSAEGSHTYSEPRLEVWRVLIGIEGDAAHEHIAQVGAFLEKDVSSEFSEEIEGNRRELARALNELEKLGVAKREPEPIRGAVRAAQATIDEQLSLIEAGRFERAHVVHKEQVQTPFHQLEESAENCATGDPSGALELLGDLEAEFGRVRPALEVETVRSRG